MSQDKSYQEYLQQIEEGQDTPEAIFALLDEQEANHNLALSFERKVMYDLSVKGYNVSNLSDFGWTREIIITELTANKRFTVLVMNVVNDIISKLLVK